MNNKKIKRAKDKIIKNNEKIAAKEENKNLPAVEPKGIKKWFKKLRVKIGLGTLIFAGLAGANKLMDDNSGEIENDKNVKVQDNMDDINKESDERIDEFAKSISVAGIPSNVTIEKETIVVEEPSVELKDELATQVMSSESEICTKTPEVLQIEQDLAKFSQESGQKTQTTVAAKDVTGDKIEEATTKAVDNKKESEKAIISKENVDVSFSNENGDSVEVKEGTANGTIISAGSGKITIDVEVPTSDNENSLKSELESNVNSIEETAEQKSEKEKSDVIDYKEKNHDDIIEPELPEDYY